VRSGRRNPNFKSAGILKHKYRKDRGVALLHKDTYAHRMHTNGHVPTTICNAVQKNKLDLREGSKNIKA
jgi:hypothetical protein